LAQALGGVVGGFWQFVAVRVFLGVGESPQFSGLVRVVRDWFNVRERGLPTGIGLCGSKLGPAIAPPLLTVLMLVHDGVDGYLAQALGIIPFSLCGFLGAKYYAFAGAER